MNKKDIQWAIDRTYNMNLENAERTVNLLTCIRKIQNKELSIDEAMAEAVDLKAISSHDRYKKTTATLLRSYGLIRSTYEVTEVAELLIDGEISFKEMLILQLIKKEFRYNDDSDVVRPFFVLFSVLLSLRATNIDQCWVDLYDYHNYLTEVKTMGQIEDTVQSILADRDLDDRELTYNIYDFDIWMSAFVTTNLISVVDGGAQKKTVEKYTINTEELEFVSYIVENESKLHVLGEYNHNNNNNIDRAEVLSEFGSCVNGLFDLMPNIVLTNEFVINNIDTDYKFVLENYLFKGLAHSQIDSLILGEDSVPHTKGFFSTLVLKSFGISGSQLKGVLKPFVNHRNLVRLNSKYKEMTKLYNYLFLGGEKMSLSLSSSRISAGFNKIYYGIPGCGKSYEVNEYIKTVYPNLDKFNQNVFRTTFYLDYSNSDFIGQLVPKTDSSGNVTYEPNFGPFTKALKRTYETDEMVYLIIEEINRGNAAAIFGDLFQLLDRLDSRKATTLGGSHKIGDSEYPITNTFIEDYLNIKSGEVIIPSNLTILATMNTSDQNVFQLDTAFKRRWRMHKVVDDYKNSAFHDYYVPQENDQELITWEEFLLYVNRFIVDNDEGFNLEDKQIGSYFVADDILTDNLKLVTDRDRVEQFNCKVLEYLWSDVAKFDRHRWVNKDNINQDKSPQNFDELVKLVNKFGIKHTLNAFNSLNSVE